MADAAEQIKLPEGEEFTPAELEAPMRGYQEAIAALVSQVDPEVVEWIGLKLAEMKGRRSEVFAILAFEREFGLEEEDRVRLLNARNRLEDFLRNPSDLGGHGVHLGNMDTPERIRMSAKKRREEMGY